MGIRERYEQQVLELYLSSHPNVDPDRARSLISQFTSDNMKDIPCAMNNNVTHERIDTSISGVFDWIETRQPIVAGNATFFMQHSEYTSPSSLMLESLMKLRDKKKGIMYTYDPGTVEYENAKIGQLSVKVVMNSDYGGCATVYSPFFSQYIPPAITQSARNLTTTLICCLEHLSGNNDRWAKLLNVNELYDLIHIVLADDDPRPQRLHGSFPVDRVLNHLMRMTNNLSMTDVNYLKRFLLTLNEDELSKLMMSFNIKLVLREYLDSDIECVMSYLKAHMVDINNMTADSIHASGYGKHAPDEIAGLIEHISNVVVDSCVYPFIMNDAEVRATHMQRVIVCVTDTDSLMVHFANYINEFHATTNIFRDSCILASALGMRIFIEHVIPKMVDNIAKNCGIVDPYYRAKFIFKNEFAFLSMTLFAKKMYAASMFVQEGNPRNPHKIAVTGLSFKKRDAAEFLEPIMLRLYDEYILTSDHINLDGILDEFYALRDLLKSDLNTHPEYFKMLTVKDISAYDPRKVFPEQLRGSIVWNNIMPDEQIEPLDRVIVVPLSFPLMDQYRSNGKVAEVLRLSLIDNEKMKHSAVICLPEHYKSIPDWIQPIIDVEYTIDKLLTPFKQLLGLFNVNMVPTRGGMIASRMIYP